MIGNLQRQLVSAYGSSQTLDCQLRSLHGADLFVGNLAVGSVPVPGT